MGYRFGNIDSGRDTNITIHNGYEVPDDWRVRAIEAMKDLNPLEREAVDCKTIQLARELQDEARPDVMGQIFQAIKEIAPAVAQVIAAALPFLLEM
jgi:hypothetical protein